MEQTIHCVVTCKGRLEHLKQSLPRILESGLHCVLVDWACPDKCGDWARANFPKLLDSGQLQIVRITACDVFRKSEALNLGAEAAITMYGAVQLCFLDADTLIEPGFTPWAREHSREGCFGVFESAGSKRDLYGVLLVSTRDFLASGGYCETFVGWGMEDVEMRLRLRLKCRVPYEYIPAALANPIQHDDSVRTRFYAEKDKHKSERSNLALLRRNVKRWTGKDLMEIPAQDEDGDIRGLLLVQRPAQPQQAQFKTPWEQR
jgi:hypothetical protein